MSSGTVENNAVEDVKLVMKKQPSPNLACEACRALKIKCFPSDPEVTAKCQRCAKRNETCIHKVPTRRKQRKRIDTQIKELEREVMALSTMLKDRDMEETSSGKTARSTSPLVPHQNEFDDVDAPSVGLEVECFDRFVRELMPSFPIVSFPPGTHAWHVREQTPILFQAIVAVASNTYGEELSRSLNQKINKTVAELVVAEGQKSLELVQALLLINAFYFPPKSFSRLQHYQYVQLSAATLHDLGLARPSVDALQHTKPITGMVGFGDPCQRLDPTSLDCRRTILGCYTLASGISHTLRRTNPLPYNTWVEQCISVLESSDSENYNDKKLAAFARLNRIVEEFSVSMGQDKNERITFSDPVTQHHVRLYNQKLAAWYHHVDPDLLPGSLSVSFHTVKIYINEVALYFDHNIEDFQPPYAIAAHRRSVEHTPDPSPPPAYMVSIMICVASAQNAIEAFLAIDIQSLRANTTITFVRMMYSTVVLAKLSGSLKASRSILAQKVEFEEYARRLIAQLELVAKGGNCLIGQKFLGALKSMLSWHDESKTHPNNLDVEGSILQPLKNMDTRESSLTDPLTGTQNPYSSPWSCDMANKRQKESYSNSTGLYHSGDSSSPSSNQMPMSMNVETNFPSWDAVVPDFPSMPMDFDLNFDFHAIDNLFNFSNVFDGCEHLIPQDTDFALPHESNTFR